MIHCFQAGKCRSAYQKVVMTTFSYYKLKKQRDPDPVKGTEKERR